MSKRLYVVFKPSDGLAMGDMARIINARFPECAKVTDDRIDIDGAWTGCLTRPGNHYDYHDFPYMCFYFCCYWDAVFNASGFRRFVMELCDILGVAEWWYIEEESTDLYDDMNAKEYEMVLRNSPGIEHFEVPRYFSAGKHHFFKDSSQRVKSLMF